MPSQATASFSRTLIEEWSDKWSENSEIEISSYEKSDSDDPVMYTIRGYATTADDIRQAAAWLSDFANTLSA